MGWDTLNLLKPTFIFLVVSIILAGLGYKLGYEQAYRDLKTGNIEQVMKEKHPSVWVELNELNKR